MISLSSPHRKKSVKLVTVGTGGVGKTSFIGCVSKQEFSSSYICTIGIDFVLYNYSPSVRAIIWDTAGQERFKSISASYFRGVDAALLFFDLSDIGSFNLLDSWVSMLPVHPKSKKKVPVILVGNKLDLKREVSHDSIKDYCKKREFFYYETSCKENIGIFDPIHKAIQEGLPTAEILNGANSNKNKKSSCCF